MYNNEEYELGNVGEDFGLQPIGDEDETFGDDDETFGDTGPLNDDWEQSHELLAQTHEQFLTGLGGNEGRGRNAQDHTGEEEEDFSPYQSMDGRGNASKREPHQHTQANDPRYSTPPRHSTSSWNTTASSMHASQGGVDDEYLRDDQMEDMFRGVLSDESERDHYSNSSQYLRSPQMHQHFMGSPMDKHGLGPLADSPAHPSIWGRSPATPGAMWGGSRSNDSTHQEPHQGPGSMANASPPPPGFAQLQKAQFPGQGFPGQQFPGQQFPGQQLPPQQFPGHQQIPDHPIPSLPPKMLSVEEIEARMRQAQAPPQHIPPQHIPPQQQPQQLHPQLQQSPPQGAPLAILQQLQQLQHLQQMRQLQFLQQQMQLSSPHDQPNSPQAGKPQPNIGPGHTTTQVYVRKNSNNFQQQNYRPVNDGNNNNNNNNNNHHTNHYASSQKQPRGLTLGDMLPTMKGGRAGHNAPNGVSRGSTRYERKLMMTPEEIDTIIHMQHAQLHSNHPYTDDYYYYQLQKRRGSQPLTRDEPPDIVRHHKPLCESTPSRTFPPKKIINDPLAGSLGRIPSHNVRAPRTLLQLVAAEMEEKEEGNNNSNNNNNAINVDDRAELGVHQSLLLAVENAFNHLLDIEDIDLILSSSNGSVNVTHLLQKRDDLSMDLFKSLNFDAYPLSKMNPPVPLPIQPFSLNASGSIPTSASINARIIPQVVQEDEFFVGLALISKGKKLLARAIPLFPASIAVPVLLAFMRNFLFLLAHNEREKEKDKGSKMFVHLNFLIGGLATPHVLLAFHTLLLFHGEMAILKLLQYQECVDVILNFMRRGHELTQEGGGVNAAHVPPAAHWRGMFGEFLKRVSFGRTLPPLHARPFMWELVLAMAVDADDFQRSMIAENMKDNILSQPHVEQLPSAQNIRNLLNL